MRLSEEQTTFAESVSDYCSQNTASVAQRFELTNDGTETTSRQTLADFAEYGWLGISLPEEFGGQGGSFTDEVVFLEAASRGLAPAHAYSTGLTAAQTYLKWGNDLQKKTICSNLAAGKLEAISLSEPGTGSDLAGIICKGVRDGDEYVINGQKTWCTAAHLAEHLLLLVREDNTGGRHSGMTLLMVPTSTPGIELREIRTMEPHTVNDVFLTDVRVPVSAVVGEAKNGWKQLMRGLSVERVIIAAMSLGAAQRSLDDAVAYMREREAFGVKISTFQVLRHRIADLATDIEMARSFVYDIASKIDEGLEDGLGKESAMAKMRCTELAKRAALEGIQILGGNGFTVEYGMEAQLRAAIAPPIYGGSNEIQREIIAKALI